MKNPLFIRLLFFILGFWPFIAFPQQQSWYYSKSKKYSLAAWEVGDIYFKIRSTPKENPFDLIFGAHIKGPGNVSFDLPGFYNGENEWVLRFSGKTKGTYTFITYSSNAHLTGLSGEIEVISPLGPERKGGIVIDFENPQQFAYENRDPYFCLAFELDWLFALDYNNANDIPNTRQIIQHVKENGFNQVVMNVYAYDVRWHTDPVPEKYDFSKPDYSPFGGNNQNPDFNRLNTRFFKHFDRVIHHLDQQGIAAHIMIYVWNKEVQWPEMYSEADNRYFDYVINRYQAFSNVIWDVSKEALDYGRADMPYIRERIARIRKLDAYQRLLSVHDYEYCSKEPEKVDFISVQNWRHNIYDHSLLVREKHPDKPIINIEHGGYEKGPYKSFQGNYTDPLTCILRNYECVFAGVYSTYYWQNTSWDIVIYDPFDDAHEWDPPKFEYYRHLATLFEKYNFNDFFPVPQKFTTNDKKGLDNLSTGALPLTNGLDLHLFLVPQSMEFVSTVLDQKDFTSMDVTWFHPLKGEFSNVGNYDFKSWFTFTKPWDDTFAVLIVGLK